MTWNTSRPQEVAPDPLPEGWLGTVSGGLPVKQIPHFEFPLVLYKHPARPTRTIIHRNAEHEVVETEEVPTEHLTKVVGCEAHIKTGGPKECVACRKSLDAAVADGWVTQPYIAPALPKGDEDLYGPRKELNLLEGKNKERRQ